MPKLKTQSSFAYTQAVLTVGGHCPYCDEEHRHEQALDKGQLPESIQVTCLYCTKNFIIEVDKVDKV